MKPVDPPVPPRNRERNRIPLANLGLGHPSGTANVPTAAIRPTAPLNIKTRSRLSMKPADAVFWPDERVLRPKESNELKVILADAPRRRASTSPVETLSVPVAPRAVSAPMVYREPGTCPALKPVDVSEGDEEDKDVVPDGHATKVGLEDTVAGMKRTLSDNTSTHNNLLTTMGEIKATQVSSEDVVNGIKMVMEYFQTARGEDRASIRAAVEARLDTLAGQVTDLLKAQNNEVVDLKLKITALTTEREAGETETRKMLESATSRLDRLEDFFMEENRLLVEENAHLLAHLEEAGAEIAQLRQEAARFEESNGHDGPTANGTNGTNGNGAADESSAAAPVTPRKTPPKTPHKSHRRTPSTPGTPVLPGMYPRVAALRREAIENNFSFRREAEKENNVCRGDAMTNNMNVHRARGSNTPPAPHLPAIAPQSPFSLRFKA